MILEKSYSITLAPPNSITTVASLTFAIPVNASIGNTRMRVIADNAVITTPCGPLASGEAEDYLVNIVLSNCFIC